MPGRHRRHCQGIDSRCQQWITVQHGELVKSYEIGGYGEVPSNSETDQSHNKNLCHVGREGVSRFPTATIARGERHCLLYDNKR
ncbi:hypothetical protein TNCV_1239231 [Trichonephila clavipes]|nr:hypothetical protein TNCV_1239231 [Trichonephila clavipes]